MPSADHFRRNPGTLTPPYVQSPPEGLGNSERTLRACLCAAVIDFPLVGASAISASLNEAVLAEPRSV